VISPGYFHQGKEIPRQVESQYDVDDYYLTFRQGVPQAKCSRK
jgi:hypothetical protein